MIHFLSYMLFSGLEFLAVFLLIFSFFNIDLRFYVKEILVSVLVLTFISYLLVITNLFIYIPISMIAILIAIFLFIRYFKVQKPIYATVITVGGFVIYGLIQFAVAALVVTIGKFDVSDLSVTFSIKTYMLQVTCTIISIVICYYVKISNGGFGFVIRGGKSRYFLITAILSTIIISLTLLGFYLNQTATYIIATFGIFLVIASIYFYLANQRDKMEFN